MWSPELMVSIQASHFPKKSYTRLLLLKQAQKTLYKGIIGERTLDRKSNWKPSESSYNLVNRVSLTESFAFDLNGWTINMNNAMTILYNIKVSVFLGKK